MHERNANLATRRTITIVGGFTLVAVTTVIVLATVPTIAQQNTGYTARLQSKGMELINAAMDAMGGRAAIEAAGVARLSAQLSVFNQGQGLHPGAAPEPANSVYIVLTYDPASASSAYQMYESDTTGQAGGLVVFTPADTFFYNSNANRIQEVEDPSTLQVFTRSMHYPAAFLLDAAAAAASVRWLGRADVEGGSHDVVTYIDALGQQIALHLDARTKLLDKVEIFESHPQYGDHSAETRFSDYRQAGELYLPHQAIHLTDGVPFTDAEYRSFEFPSSIESQLMSRPDGAEIGPPVGGQKPSPTLKAEQLGDGVYAVFNATGGYNVMFVDLGTSVFAIEPIISSEVAAAVIEEIGITIPGKPVEHVAMTHYHFDHSGGLMRFLAQGTTVVANPGDVDFIHDVAKAPRTLDSDCVLKGEPKIEVVEGKRSYGSGSSSVELYQVGPNPHANEILVVYIPALKLMYVADIYNFQGTVTPASEQALALADRIEQLGLEIERVIPTHGQEATGEQFWESVRLGREAASQ